MDLAQTQEQVHIAHFYICMWDLWNISVGTNDSMHKGSRRIFLHSGNSPVEKKQSAEVEQEKKCKQV